MSQSSIPEALALAGQLSEDPREAEATRVKAAALVDAFVESQALPALDAMIAAAEQGSAPDPAVAREATRTTTLLDDEVARFHALARNA